VNCKNCNSTLNEGAQFCTGCGQAVQNEAPQTHPTFDNPGKEPKKKSKIIGTILSIIGFIIVAVIWNVFFSNDEVLFETRGDSQNFRMALPRGWELAGNRVRGNYLSNDDCTVLPGIVLTSHVNSFLELESETVRIRGREWEKHLDDGVRILHTTYNDELYAVTFTDENGVCERDFDRIERSMRLVR